LTFKRLGLALLTFEKLVKLRGEVPFSHVTTAQWY